MGNTMLTGLVLLCMLYTVCCIRILIVPADHGAHVNFMCELGQTLQNAGHYVRVLTARSEKLVKSFGLQPIVVTNINLANATVEDLAEVIQESQSYIYATVQAMHTVTSRMAEQAREVMANKALMKQLFDEQFEFAVMDSNFPVRHNLVIPYKLGIPYVSVVVTDNPWLVNLPVLPSVEGFIGLNYMDKQSGFLDRVKNLFVYIMIYNVQPLLLPLGDQFVKDSVPEKPFKSIATLYRESELFLMNSDTICLETSHISAPHYVYIGGLGAHDPRPLPQEYLDIVNNAKGGVILVTFGSAVAKINLDKLEAMMKAFSELSQTVIMRYNGQEPRKKPSNVIFKQWVPQNDLLGHPNTRLFITHGGANGQIEAVHHGVPMIVMPLFADQFNNAIRAERKNYGKMVNFQTLISAELSSSIQEVLNNPKYKEEISKCSKIKRSLPTAQNEAVRWIEHVMKYGGQHLKPYYYDMPLYQLFMLDIAAAFILMVVITVCTCRLCCRKCCRKGKLQKNQNEAKLKRQ